MHYNTHTHYRCLEEQMQQGTDSQNPPEAEAQAWSLWMLLPRLLFRHHRSGNWELSQRQVLNERLIAF